MERIHFLNPRSDQAFVRLVEQCVAGGVDSAAGLERHLRQVYPLAVVRERGLSCEIVPAWYIYRDGRWVGPGEG